MDFLWIRQQCLHLAAALTAAAALAACGGGQGDEAEPPSLEQPAAEAQASGRSMTLSWSAPTGTADGRALTDLAGYRVMIGTQSQTYGTVAVVADPAASGHTIEGLEPGTYYVVVTAFDAHDNESAPSLEVTKTIR